MLNIKFIPNKLTKLFGLVLASNLIIIGLVNPAIAEQNSAKTRTTDFGLPTHRRDGGSRGGQDSCVANVKTENQNLMALIPQTTVGMNAAAAPKLFFYIPEFKNPSTLEFVLRNEQDQMLYEAFFSTEGNGIMSVEVPAEINSQMLKPEQNYHWYLSMICNNQERSRDLVVEGWMHQAAIDSATQAQLNQVSSLEKAKVYRQKGFWFDALSVLAENLDSAPDKTMMQQQWSTMLSSVGLEDLASESFIEPKLIDNPANSL